MTRIERRTNHRLRAHRKVQRAANPVISLEKEGLIEGVVDVGEDIQVQNLLLIVLVYLPVVLDLKLKYF